MDALTEWAVSNLEVYGPLLLVVVAYVGSLGIPFPLTVVILAAGASARAGLLAWPAALLACVLGAALADHSEYALGRWAQPWLVRRFSRNALWQQAQGALARQGAWAILLTRFWLMPLAPAVNVLAGAQYSYGRFLLYDVTGQVVWVLIYGGLGYAFATQVEGLGQAAGVFSAVSLAATGLVIGGYALVRRRRARRSAVTRDVVTKG